MSDPTTPDDKLRELAQAATPGPWNAVRTGVIEDPDGDEDYGFAKGPTSVRNKFPTVAAWREQFEADARFIAAANPLVILSLLDRLRDQADELRESEAAYMQNLGVLARLVPEMETLRDRLREAEARTQTANAMVCAVHRELFGTEPEDGALPGMLGEIESLHDVVKAARSVVEAESRRRSGKDRDAAHANLEAALAEMAKRSGEVKP